MNNFKKASSWIRFAAFLIDSIILLIPLFIVSILLSLFKITSFGWVFGALIVVSYNVFFLYRFGATIGKMILKIKVVDVSYNDAGLVQIIIRETIGSIIAGILLNLGYLWILIDKDKQGWNDKIARTFVVKLDSNNTLIASQKQKVAPFEKVIFYILAAFVIFSIGLTVIYSYVGFPLKVTDTTMQPNFTKGEYVLTTTHFKPKRSDVVVYTVVYNRSTYHFMQRVIALPGEHVMLKDSNIYINGKLLNQGNKIPDGTQTLPGPFLREGVGITIPANYYLLMGDNREESVDSRTIGLVPLYAIKAKVTGCILNCKK